MNDKLCYKCGIIRPLSDFHKGLHDGKDRRCKICKSKERKARYTTDIEKVTKQNHDWIQNNPVKARERGRRRRARKLGINEKYTKSDELYTRSLFNNKCFNCGSKDNLTIDHNYPLILGNALTRSNAVLLCSSCNSKKKDKTPEDFYNSIQLNNLNKLGIIK